MKKFIWTIIIIGAIAITLNGCFMGSFGTSPPTRSLAKTQNPPIQKNFISINTKKTERGKMRFIAEYEISGKLYGARSYGTYPQTHIPLDFAVGWGALSTHEIFNKINVRQSKRFAYPSYKQTIPISTEEFNTSFSNNHLIPANQSIYQKLKAIKKGDLFTLKGYLVNYREGTSRAWYDFNSSKTRTDEGDGACEVMYVEHVILY
ncbi:MAG: hypothetical protein AB8B83_07375 [Bdellovibrionales bacterium]